MWTELISAVALNSSPTRWFDELLPEVLGELFGQQSACDIRAAARGIRDHDLYWLAWPCSGLRARERDHRAKQRDCRNHTQGFGEGRYAHVENSVMVGQGRARR